MGQRCAFRLGSCVTLGLVFFSVCVVSIQAQSTPGFISIDCGGSPSVDNVTTFSWEGDDNYTLTGLSGTVPTTIDSTLDNYQALKTFRYFPIHRSKHCYDLPTSKSNISFLLRAMFLQGSASELTLPISFDIAINGTTVSTVSYDEDSSSDTLSTPQIYEGIFYSPGRLTHVCLVTDIGVPFISSLELRQFTADDVMYNYQSSTENYLSMLRRFNCGAPQGTPTVRYPDDTFDRLWSTPGSWSKVPTISGIAATDTYSVTNDVPPAVMKDAWAGNGPNSSFWYSFPLDSIFAVKLYIGMYFEELESHATFGDRVFDVEINAERNSFWMETAPVGYANRVDWSDWSASIAVNMTFTATMNSSLGPMLNAFEVYAQYAFNDSVTEAQDVDGLSALQLSFNLTDWQGDPCYPVPWDWVSCTGDMPARVDELLLSGFGISAVIPASISDLTALTAIHLDNNSLYGSIPDSFASLPDLSYLSLDDNDLSGAIPVALLTKLGSNFLYYGNSLLGNSPKPSNNSTTKKSSSNIGVIVGAAAGGAAVLVIFGCLLACCLCKTPFTGKPKHHQNQAKVEIETSDMGSAPRSRAENSAENGTPQSPNVNQSTTGEKVSYDTVQIATSNFSMKIGEGSFGSVYLGRLNNKDVAVKLHNIQSDQGKEEFLTELDILKRVHHRNLVSLVAYCDDGDDLILIYEFEVNGTLREWLYESEGRKFRGTLDWKRRLQIALDAAQGLEYLHKMCVPPVIHRDVKSSNILLDQSMMAKVADFGLSKATPVDRTSGFTTKVKGTRWYLDMEYFQLGKVTHKTDVFSYGVVLAEIITGLPPYKIDDDGRPVVLVDFVDRMVKTNDMQSLADPTLEGGYNIESMWKMAELVLSCVNQTGTLRPEFTEVVSSINEALELEKTFATHSPFLPTRSFSFKSNRYRNLH